jgi:hypothetical protein
MYREGQIEIGTWIDETVETRDIIYDKSRYETWGKGGKYGYP